MSESGDVAITTVLSILATVNIVGNIFVCAIIKRNREMRTPMNYLLVNMAVADIQFAAFIAPRIFYKLFSEVHIPDGMTGTLLCKLLTDGVVAWIGAASSFVTLLAIAFERYYTIMHPHSNKWKLTRCNLKVIIPGSWVFGLVLDIPMLLVKDVKESNSGNSCASFWPEEWMAKAYSVTWLVVVFLLLALMVWMYSKVVYTLWFRTNDDNQGVIRVRKRATLMVVIVTVVFGICWGADTVLYTLTSFVSYDCGPLLVATANVMILFNSAINPFVYALISLQFREKMKAMLFCTAHSASRVRPTPEVQDIEVPSITCTISPVHTAE